MNYGVFCLLYGNHKHPLFNSPPILLLRNNEHWEWWRWGLGMGFVFCLMLFTVLKTPHIAWSHSVYLLLLCRWLLASGCHSLSDSWPAVPGSCGAIWTKFHQWLCRDISLPGLTKTNLTTNLNLPACLFFSCLSFIYSSLSDYKNDESF